MNIPTTTKLTLKRIVEALPDIPNNGFGTEPPKMSSEQKKKLMELGAMYENFGQCLQNEEALMNSAKGVTELCELAETYALNECGEWFQQEIVKKDMQNLKKRVSEFQKIVQETYARMQQAGVAYQDIGHVLGRYYDLKGTQGQDQEMQQKPGPQPLQEYNKLTGPRPKEFDYPNYTPSPKQPETCMDCGNTFSAGPEDVKCPKCRAKGSKKSK